MNQRWETGRVEAFSDGVFAIAITLLVLDIRIEPDQYDHLLKALLDEWSSYFAYVTSFFTIGGVWTSHHALFERLRTIDTRLMRLNLLLLLAVSFLPFPTGLMAEALREPLGRRPEFAILKGRNNYLCLNKLRNGPEDQQDALFYAPTSPLGAHVKRLHQWAASTTVGDRDELVPGVPDSTWRMVSVTARECLGAAK